jgi:hypothetical protein
MISKADAMGCLIIFAFMILLSPFFIPILIYRQRWRRSWFIGTLSEKHRLLSWQDFLTRTQNESGSIIIEFGNKAIMRFWFTNDRILALAPMKPPEFRELDFTILGGADYHPFARWCYEHYLSLETGNAILAYPERTYLEGLPFWFKEEFQAEIKKRFPNQDVVFLTFYDARYV